VGEGPNRRLTSFVGVVCAFGVLLLVAVALRSELSWLFTEPLIYSLCALLVLLGELRPILIARPDSVDEVTVSTTFSMVLVLVGPLWFALAVQALSVAVEDVRGRKAPEKVAFNMAQYVVTLCAARGAYVLVSGDPFLLGSPLAVPDDLPAVLVASAVFFVVNNSLASMVTALATGQPVLRHLLSDVRFQIATSGVLLAFAPVVALSLQQTAWLLPLLVLPMAAVHRSVTLAAQHERQAMHDSLTGLPNRALFRLRVERAIEETRWSGWRCGVVLIDLDHFKDINDTLGHHVGDILLVEVAERLQQSLRSGDSVARLGGDEFAVLAAGSASGESIVGVARRLLAALEDPFTVEGVRLDVQASLGVALHPEHGTDVDTLVQHADTAMYAAKVHRGEVRLYEPAADLHTTERLVLATELRDALREEQFFLAYQPKVDARTGAVLGMEALVRWRHPRRGVVMPDEFLGVVENTGLIGPLTLTVLELAVSELAGWRSAGHDVSVSVNLSVRHLTDHDLPTQIGLLLRRHGVPASALTLEVTETVVMADPTRAVAVLRRLRELGVTLAVDDFGTGYSSLAYLRRLDVQELKIDKSFVLGVSSDEGDAVIVRSTIELGHNLGLRLVAEGVEDEPAVAMLRGWGCDVLQGYLISRPLPPEEVLPWLRRHAAGWTVPVPAVRRC
jgi:diguanylate cyclase (GGDEF)-like protein